MEDIKKILTQASDKAMRKIRSNVSRLKATGKTLSSLFRNVSDTKLTIGGSGGLLWLETGRPPAKSNQPKFEIDELLKWMSAKGIGSGMQAKEKERLAKFIKYRINAKGTRKWQKGQGSIVEDVYTSTLDEMDSEITRDILEIDFIPVYKGKNIIIE